MVQQIIHGFMLLYIIFLVAETGKILLHNDPQYHAPITIWQETQQPHPNPFNVLF